MAKKKFFRKHIVLPNGMWRFVKSGTKTSPAVTKKTRKRRGVSKMARRGRRRSFSRGSSNKLMSGMFRPTGLVGAVVLGMGAAAISNYVPVNVPYKQEIAAGLVGGIPAAGAVYVIKMLGNNTGATTSTGLY